MNDSIFSRTPQLSYHEEAPLVDFEAFKKVVMSRRSVRVFEDKEIPADVVRECLDLALMAPNSSNLQPWEFYWVRNEDKKKSLVKACFGQPAAATASVLIVCIARPKMWKKHAKQMIEVISEKQKNPPGSVLSYYKKIVPLAYGLMGPWGIFSPLKWLLFNTIGAFKVMARDPVSPSALKLWAHKSTALACENLMLSFRAAGYDSCPMEGFDEARVRKILDLPWSSSVCMVIGAGKRQVGGVYGPRIRFPSSQFVFEV